MSRAPLFPALQRRTLLAGALAITRFGFAPIPAWAQTNSAWGAWKADFLRPSGRVVDPGQGGISHSEGQGYALLLAQAFGDRGAFERIEHWTRSALAQRQDALMAWRWQDGAVADWRNATDGDLLRAWALLRADRDSGWHGHRETAHTIAGAIAGICLAPDPRASEERLLKPFDTARADPQGVLVNPSYYLPRALRELGEATGRGQLVRVADHGETLLRDRAAMRDWVLVTPDGLRPAPGFDDRFGWDGLRVPLYLAWSGRWDHPAMAEADRRFQAATVPGHVATVTGPAGEAQAESDLPGFRAVAALARQTNPQDIVHDGARRSSDYYARTLALLALIAWREGEAALR